MPRPENCNRCGRERSPAEAVAYGSRCEDCYCYNIHEEHAAEYSQIEQVWKKHHQPELRLDNQINNKVLVGEDDEDYEGSYDE